MGIRGIDSCDEPTAVPHLVLKADGWEPKAPNDLQQSELEPTVLVRTAKQPFVEHPLNHPSPIPASPSELLPHLDDCAEREQPARDRTTKCLVDNPPWLDETEIDDRAHRVREAEPLPAHLTVLGEVTDAMCDRRGS